MGLMLKGLNPYSIGIWSATTFGKFADEAYGVLILILLEYGLRHVGSVVKVEFVKGLNPYSIGIWSATAIYKPYKTNKQMS